MNHDVRIDRAVQRLNSLGASFEPCGTPVELLESRFGHRLPPSFRALVSRYRFRSFECGGVEFFANLGGAEPDDLSRAPFEDEFMSEWLRNNGLICIGRPSSGSYDPVCLDVNSGRDPAVVQLDHEAILQGRKKVARRMLSESFIALMEAAGA